MLTPGNIPKGWKVGNGLCIDRLGRGQIAVYERGPTSYGDIKRRADDAIAVVIVPMEQRRQFNEWLAWWFA